MMIRKLLSLFICQCFLLGFASGQEIFGLKKMSADYVHLFTLYHNEAKPSSEELAYDLQRIKNIPGIGKAELSYDSTGEPSFIVKESSTLLPIINFGGIKDNFWYKLGVADINFLGQGKNISLHYQNNDGKHAGQIYYRDPFLIGSKWGYSIDLNRWSSLEPLFFDEGQVNYDFQYWNIGGSVIRNFGIRKSLEVGLNYFVENYEKSPEQSLSSPPGPLALKQPKVLLNTSYNQDFVNYDFFMLDGLTWKITMQNVYNIDDNDWFHIAQFQAKQYFQFNKIGNLALRLRLAFSTNNYSPFAPFVADSYVNLRGVGNRIDRGTGQAIFNLEYRQTLLSAYPFGFQLVVFSDLGSWRNPGGSLSEIVSKNSIRHFVGGGFRVIYQQVFGATLRVDYGIDLYNPEQRGIVVGLGQYF